MGWYDAYRKDTVNSRALSMIDSNAGAGASSFGNAFVDIGKSIDEWTGGNKKATEETNKNNQTKLDNEFMTSYDPQNGTYNNPREGVSPNVLFDIDGRVKGYKDEQTKKQEKADIWVQTQDNESYLKSAYDSKSFTDFKTNYKVDDTNSVDSDTMIKAEKYFIDKDNSSAKIDSKIKDLKHQKALNKATKSKDDSFKYTEVTGAKIKSLIATSMGMDAPNFNMDDTTKQQYENDVIGVSLYSKEYNLEPNLALDVYRHPEKYIFTKDNKVIARPIDEDVLGLREEDK